VTYKAVNRTGSGLNAWGREREKAALTYFGRRFVLARYRQRPLWVFRYCYPLGIGEDHLEPVSVSDQLHLLPNPGQREYRRLRSSAGTRSG